MSFLLKNFINKATRTKLVNNRILCKTSNNFIKTNQSYHKWNKSRHLEDSFKVNYLNRQYTRALSFTNKSQFR